jgi:hypothetical protein
VEEWENGAPPGVYDGRYWRAQWWARVPVSKRRTELRHTAKASDSMTSTSARNGGPATLCPTPRWCAGNWPGCPESRWLGMPKEKVEELFWDTITQVRADLAGVCRKLFPPIYAKDGI